MRDRSEPGSSPPPTALPRRRRTRATRRAAAAIAHLEAATDALIGAAVDLVNLNARAVEKDAATITASLRRRAFWLANVRDALAFLFVIAGTLLSFRGARQSALIAAERHRRDAERLEEMELFSSRVAHDLRDPLATIVMMCGREGRLETLADAREMLTRIAAQAQRMGVTIDALLTFARAARPARAPGLERRDRCRPRACSLTTWEPLAAEAHGSRSLVEPILPR